MKLWFIQNLSKLTLIFAVIGAVSGVAALAVGISAINNNPSKGLTYYWDKHHKIVWGNQIIWERPNEDPQYIILYFADKSKDQGHDIKWNGIYPDGYFY